MNFHRTSLSWIRGQSNITWHSWVGVGEEGKEHCHKITPGGGSLKCHLSFFRSNITKCNMGKGAKISVTYYLNGSSEVLTLFQHVIRRFLSRCMTSKVWLDRHKPSGSVWLRHSWRRKIVKTTKYLIIFRIVISNTNLFRKLLSNEFYWTDFIVRLTKASNN